MPNKNHDQQVAEDMRAESLAAKLTKLYEVMSPAGELPSDATVADGIFEKTGVQMSGPYLCLLRTGKRTNPTVQNVQAIAEYFGVPASYLIDAGADAAIESELRLVKAMRDNGIRDIATRLSGLTPESIGNLAGIVDRLRELENLPPIGPTDEPST
ncbi:XRE family transcriptional regulator [Mycobacteroides abscessus]|uniref:XRE family transcriptional regulator n=1 Tax=Mycobacteroides abscessus TaxID=36809 RepID=A0ABD7HFV9_9MYCO|nr:XRE family transcriptional regulator [Mycobacteroides abscessus]PVB10615.1 XRE family transcriptional regulator [Mycobacteroides abscessus]RIR38108.1 XRE family transcriptional regulator [Mycobacteroides abscessus]RIS47271.1 XRE family transcriptional regulator [Mycobacteroides abscessus]RIT25903.1 XRE family transcriptional regulator [Mycobacteroides abscessus]RIU20402.1 XRE family transcriptional regulator [Mycobacteroides abscessus]